VGFTFRQALTHTATSVTKNGKDILTVGILIAAIILFIGNGIAIGRSVVATLTGIGDDTDQALYVALILNIAIIMFGWRRYSELEGEVEERTVSEERARSLAHRDPLTGFHNRRSIADTGADLLMQTQARGKELAVIMIDLDHFKTVNDLHGHAIGDALLRSVASEIVKLVPPRALTARLGGDEFACAFAYDRANPETVSRVTEALISRLAQPFDADGVYAHISASAGIATSDHDCSSIDAVMRRADIAMYVSKGQGRNRYIWFDAAMERELHARNELEGQMRFGIPKGEFIPYFEQQVDLHTGKLQGFEVLARWNHPTRGLISPDVFIPIAEETGMIGDLSMSIIAQSLIEARDWDPSLSISVNISPTQLRDPWLPQKIVKLLTETAFPAGRLEIEITESALFDNLALAQSIVGSLKNQGIRLALDDFGTGYSSLAHLRALPFDRIKIDKSFILSLNDNVESNAIVNAIARLGENLNMPVTAEGIEDAGIQERLRQLGCHKGQGWFYGRPTSIAATRVLLAERNLLPLQRLAQPGFSEAVMDGLPKAAAIR
jgi:diguanylate cyclase (GGDEF)-like protein